MLLVKVPARAASTPYRVISSRALRAFGGRCVIAVVVTVSLTAGGVVVVNQMIDARVSSLRRIKLAVAPAPPQGSNFLIIGSDSRAFVSTPDEAAAFGDPTSQEGQRSDTLMVAHVEPDAKRTLVVSFPRDLLVNVPGLAGKNKINAAYSVGGAQNVIDMLHSDFDVTINHYIEVDFKSFQAVVDAIGKVSLFFQYPTRDDPDVPAGSTDFTAPAGCIALNGETALSYVRARHMQYLDPVTKSWRSIDAAAPDLFRISRQQAFIRELSGIAVSKSLTDPFLANTIADKALGYVKVDQNLDRNDVNALIRALRTINTSDQSALDFETLPVVANPADPLSSLVLLQPDANATLARLRTFEADAPTSPAVSPSSVKVQVLDGTGSADAQGALAALERQGFRGAGIGSSTHTPVVTSEVRYATTQARDAELLLDYFPDAKLVIDPKATGKVVVVLGESFHEITVPPAPQPSTPTSVPASTSLTAPTTSTTPTKANIAVGTDCSK